MTKEHHVLPAPQRRQLKEMRERDGWVKTREFIGLSIATIKAAAYGLPVQQGTVAHIVQKLEGDNRTTCKEAVR